MLCRWKGAGATALLYLAGLQGINPELYEAAIIDGWEDKISEWASLVDVTDGAASRKLGDLIEHGQGVIKYYQGKLGKGPDTSLARSRTRVGKIIRRG